MSGAGGRSHFELYDDDGSLLPYIQEWMTRDGVVSCFPNRAGRFAKLDPATKRSWRCRTEILAFDHRAYRNKGHVDWMVNLGSLDVYTLMPQLVATTDLRLGRRGKGKRQQPS